MTERTAPRPALRSAPTPEALRIRVVAGMLYGAARFVPVPLLDDVLRERVARWMVHAMLPAGVDREATGALWTDESGCLAGALRATFMAPIRLLLFPLRKVLAIALGARWFARDLAEMLLLGRVIDHALATGLLAESRAPEELARSSRELRIAFDVAFRGTSTRLFGALLRTAIGPLGGLVRRASLGLRRLRRAMPGQPRLDAETRKALDADADRIESMLSRPEIAKFLGEFDARVLENLRVLESRRGS